MILIATTSFICIKVRDILAGIAILNIFEVISFPFSEFEFCISKGTSGFSSESSSSATVPLTGREPDLVVDP